MTDIFDDMFDAAGALSDVDINTSKDLSKLVPVSYTHLRAHET